MSRARIVAAAGATIAVAFALVAAFLLRDPTPRFLARRGTLAHVAQGRDTVIKGYRVQPVTLTSSSGLTVNLTVRRALADTVGPLPLVVILGGHHTGANAVRLLPETQGAIVAAVSYPFTGDPRPDAATFLREIPKIREAFLDTPPALMLSLEYLLRLPGVETTRVEAVGVSLGAPFVCVAGALDSRFTRVWAIHGSGGSFAPLEMNMRRTIRFAPLRYISAATANAILSGPRLDPTKWVQRIAPRPFVMVNAAEDERMPRAKVDALFAAASEPKEIVWLPGAHVRGDTATIRRLTNVVLERLRSERVSPRADAGAPAPSQSFGRGGRPPRPARSAPPTLTSERSSPMSNVARNASPSAAAASTSWSPPTWR